MLPIRTHIRPRRITPLSGVSSWTHAPRRFNDTACQITMAETQTETPETDTTAEQAKIDRLDPNLRSKAQYGPDASQKAMLSATKTPNYVLDALGVETPREYIDGPEDVRAITTTKRLSDGSLLHRFQDARKVTEVEQFGDFGAVEMEVEEVDDRIWTVLGFVEHDDDPDEIVLAVVGEWSRKVVPETEFVRGWEQLWLTDGQPRWGY